MNRQFAAEDDWFRPRAYLHFDPKIRLPQRSSVEAYVRDSKRVAQHRFYPFISYNLTKYKIVENEERGVRYLDDKGVRTLSYAAHMDAHIYAYYAEMLGSFYERFLDTNSLSESIIAFRKLRDKESGKPKSNIHFARDAFRAIKEAGNCTVYAFDIKGFFDNLKPEVLKQAWSELLGADRLPEDQFAIFKSVSVPSMVDREDVYKLCKLPRNPPSSVVQICSSDFFRTSVKGEKSVDPITGYVRRGLIVTKPSGIPQGSPISGLLANIYMSSFDKLARDAVAACGGKYFRYCDDLFFLFPTGRELKIEDLVNKWLKELGLRVNESKSERSVFTRVGNAQECDRPIQYLGFVYDGKQISIRPASISRHLRKMRSAVKMAKLAQVKFNDIRFAKGRSLVPLYRKKLNRRFTHAGDSNFITYGLRAAQVMNSDAIRRQMKRVGTALEREIAKPLSSARRKTSRL